MYGEDGAQFSVSEEDTIFQIISGGKDIAMVSAFDELVQLLEAELLQEMDGAQTTDTGKQEDYIIGEAQTGGSSLVDNIIVEEDEEMERGSIFLQGSKHDPTKSITETHDQLLQACQLFTKTLQIQAQVKANVSDFISSKDPNCVKDAYKMIVGCMENVSKGLSLLEKCKSLSLEATRDKENMLHTVNSLKLEISKQLDYETELAQEMVELSKRINFYEEEIRNLESKCKKLESSKDEAVSKAETLNIRFNELTQQLEISNQEKSALKTQIKNLNENVNFLEALNDNHKDDIVKDREMYNTLEEANKHLATFKEGYYEKKEKLHKAENQIHALESKLAATIRDLNSEHQYTVSLKLEVQELKERIGDLESQRREFMNNLSASNIQFSKVFQHEAGMIPFGISMPNSKMVSARESLVVNKRGDDYVGQSLNVPLPSGNIAGSQFKQAFMGMRSQAVSQKSSVLLQKTMPTQVEEEDDDDIFNQLPPKTGNSGYKSNDKAPDLNFFRMGSAAEEFKRKHEKEDAMQLPESPQLLPIASQRTEESSQSPIEKSRRFNKRESTQGFNPYSSRLSNRYSTAMPRGKQVIGSILARDSRVSMVLAALGSDDKQDGEFELRQDYMNMSIKDKVVVELNKLGDDIQPQQCYSDTAFLFDTKYRKTRIILVITQCSIAFFSLRSFKLLKLYSLKTLKGVTISSSNYTLCVLHFNTMADILMESYRRLEMICYLNHVVKIAGLPKFELNVRKRFIIKGESKNSMPAKLEVSDPNLKLTMPFLQDTLRNSKKNGFLSTQSKHWYGTTVKEYFCLLSNIGIICFKKYGVSYFHSEQNSRGVPANTRSSDDQG